MNESLRPTDLSPVLSKYFNMEFQRSTLGLYNSEPITTVQTDKDAREIIKIFQVSVAAMRRIANPVFDANSFTVVFDQNKQLRIQFRASDLEENPNNLYSLRPERVKLYADELIIFKSTVENYIAQQSGS